MTRIRKSPTMTGPFAETIQEFIQYKRSAGFKYADEPKCFLDKKRAEGKHYYVYMIAGCNKFLRIYYARVSEYLNSLEK